VDDRIVYGMGEFVEEGAKNVITQRPASMPPPELANHDLQQIRGAHGQCPRSGADVS
jgi:hypothetical protein